MGLFVITQCFTNITLNLQCGVVQTKYNIRHIKPYKSDTKLEDYGSKICTMISLYELPVIYFCLERNRGTKYIIGCTRGNLF